MAWWPACSSCSNFSFSDSSLSQAASRAAASTDVIGQLWRAFDAVHLEQYEQSSMLAKPALHCAPTILVRNPALY